MIRSIITGLTSLLLLTTGCGKLIREEPPPVRYELRYPSPEVRAGRVFDGGVRVWRFSTTDPYGKTDMVILREGQRVATSSRHRWIAGAGDMIADRLVRDLATGGLFPQVLDAASPVHADLELSGHVITFAWREEGSRGRPVLELQVSLTSGDGAVLLEKRYRLEGDAALETSPEAMSEGMSELVRRFSRVLQQDLADAASRARREPEGEPPSAPAATDT